MEGDRNYKVDLLPPLSLAVHVWLILFGTWSAFVTTLANEFFSIHTGYWISIIIGVPAATVIAFGIATFAFFFQKVQGPPTSPRMEPSDFVAAQKKVTRAWIVGCIATVTSLFAHYNPGGNGRDFSPTNIVDAFICAALTYGFYKRKIWCALLLLAYFIFWKMALWSYNQPYAIAFAGIIMAIFLWHGIAGLIHLKRWKNRNLESPR